MTMFSKIFELCVSARIVPLLHVDDLQFGFVSGKGCHKALFTLDSVVNYYTICGQSCFVGSLDATKAFDRVNHYALFS